MKGIRTGWWMRVGMAFAVLAMTAGSLTAISASPAQAAALAVTRTDDPAPNGCQPGDCSLREAIIAANATTEADVIALGSTFYVLSLSGVDETAGAGDLDITGDLTITGAGQGSTFVNGNGVDRVFDILAGAGVHIGELSVVNGLAAGASIVTGAGAGGGGLRNSGSLTLTNVTVQDNEAGVGRTGFITMSVGRSGSGGGIANSGSLTLAGVTLKNNRAGAGALGSVSSTGTGGNGGHGGGVWNTGVMTATDATLSQNHAGAGGTGEGGGSLNAPGPGKSGGDGGHGGALYNSGTATITNSTLSLNKAGSGGVGGYSWGDTPGPGGDGGNGGAVFNASNSTELTRSIVTENAGGAAGELGSMFGFGGFVATNVGTPGEAGGAFVQNGQLVVESSTFWENAVGQTATGPSFLTPTSAEVAGIHVTSTGGSVLTNGTVSGHTSGYGVSNLGTLSIEASTFTGTGQFTTSGVTFMGRSVLDDLWVIAAPNFTSTGYNVVRGSGFPGIGSDVSPSFLNLGSLLVGDLPPTHPLLDGSDAIDVVPNSECQVATDARGVSRPQGPACDAGAHERMSGDTVGLIDVSQGIWNLRNSAGVVSTFGFGNPGDLPIAGDWDGDGVATPGLYRQSDGFFYSRNSNSTGIADVECFAGNPEDVPVVGDWDGDGDDNLGIYRPSVQMFFLFTSSCTGTPMGGAQISFLFGNPGDNPVSGDWDADGIDEIGLHRESAGFFYWRDTLTTGIATGQIFFGDPSDRFVSGDWGFVDNVDTPSIFRPSDLTFYFRHTLTQGIADSQFTWGGAEADWLPVSGRFGLD
jgi:CSLREA domain-containing protein